MSGLPLTLPSPPSGARVPDSPSPLWVRGFLFPLPSGERVGVRGLLLPLPSGERVGVRGLLLPLPFGERAGVRGLQSFSNPHQNAFEILKDVIVPESEDPIAVTF
jgi:hypothetical protein